MKAFSKKCLAVAAGLALSSASALASHISAVNFAAEQFLVNPAAIGEINPITGMLYTPFYAGSIQFAYRGIVSQTGTGAFSETGSAQFSAFLSNVGGSNLGALATGLDLVPIGGGPIGYHLYATFTGTGTTTAPVGGGVNGQFTTFSVQFFADPNNDTTFNAPGTAGSPSAASTAPTGGVIPDDVLVLTGNLDIGGFHVNTGLAGGDFDARFNVTGFGATNFFSITQDGHRLTNGDFAGNNNLVQGVAPPPATFANAEIVGSGDTTFASVPEPTSLALVGIALVGGALARRKAQA